jgi:uncharacterized membrane protein HdeD (DUF308 family)
MMLAAGVLVICRPATGIRLIMLIIIVTMILKGLGSLSFYFTMARHMVGGKLQLYKGIILLDIGMFFMTLDDVPIIYLMLYLLVANLISGVIEILGAREARQMEAGSWKMKTAIGAADVLFGLASIFCLGRPNLLVYIYATGLAYSAVLRIVSALRRSAIVYIQ